MSQRNGDKSRFQINRKRVVLRRAKIRALVAAGSAAPTPDAAEAPVAKRRVKPARPNTAS